MRDFLKTTMIGGVLFLLPVAIAFPPRPCPESRHPRGQAGGDRTRLRSAGQGNRHQPGTVLAVLLLMLISFTAGMLARTAVGARVSRARR